jgi:hypothetical protein
MLMNAPHFLLVPICLASSVFADTLIVTNILDSGAGSLRATVAAASDGDVINFDSSLNGATITLTSGEIAIISLDVSINASALPNGITISGNDASRIFLIYEDSSVSLNKLTMTNGQGAGQGGALFFQGTNLTVTDCVIQDSTASTNGGGAYVGNTSTTTASFLRCRIQGCSSGNLSFGGGIFFGGGGQYSITNSVISGNVAFDGAGICNISASPSIFNSTIQGNRATGNKGGGMTTDTTTLPGAPLLIPLIRNTIFWGNRGLGTTNVAAQQLRNVSNSKPNVDYSLIEQANGTGNFDDSNKTTWGANNLNGFTSNPSFVAASTSTSAPTSASDVRLFTGSACLNVGDNTLVPPLTTDLAGKPRIQAGTVDFGAYEGGYETFAHLYPALNPGGDDNNNGSSNLLEYSLGINPVTSSGSLPLPSMARDETSLLLTLTQRNNAADLNHIWQTTPSLAPLNWETMVEGVHYSVESISNPGTAIDQFLLRLTSSDAKRFYRQTFVTQP